MAITDPLAQFPVTIPVGTIIAGVLFLAKWGLPWAMKTVFTQPMEEAKEERKNISLALTELSEEVERVEDEGSKGFTEFKDKNKDEMMAMRERMTAIENKQTTEAQRVNSELAMLAGKFESLSGGIEAVRLEMSRVAESNSTIAAQNASISTQLVEYKQIMETERHLLKAGMAEERKLLAESFNQQALILKDNSVALMNMLTQLLQDRK